jgi:hypothetical protein
MERKLEPARCGCCCCCQSSRVCQIPVHIFMFIFIFTHTHTHTHTDDAQRKTKGWQGPGSKGLECTESTHALHARTARTHALDALYRGRSYLDKGGEEAWRSTNTGATYKGIPAARGPAPEPGD